MSVPRLEPAFVMVNPLTAYSPGALLQIDWGLEQPMAGTEACLEIVGSHGNGVWQQNVSSPFGSGQLDLTLPTLARGSYRVKITSTDAPQISAYSQPFTFTVNSALDWAAYP